MRMKEGGRGMEKNSFCVCSRIQMRIPKGFLRAKRETRKERKRAREHSVST